MTLEKIILSKLISIKAFYKFYSRESFVISITNLVEGLDFKKNERKYKSKWVNLHINAICNKTSDNNFY